MAVFQTTTWRLISGVLGIICLLLMAALGVLLSNSLTKQSVQPGPSTDLQEEYNLHEEKESGLGCSGPGCYSCQEKWIGYQCNCYFVSDELKTWKDSRDFCVSHNSSLLQIQTRNELNFMKFSTSFYWIGLSYGEEHDAWLWENKSTLSQDLFPFPKSVNPKNCMMYGPGGRILDGHCGKKFRYICKQQLI
nr:natural killer cells antigen CD94-like isoform X2 [Odocoileus virginianus texanus]